MEKEAKEIILQSLDTGASGGSVSAPRISWRIPAIDGLRALAILMVFTYHVWEFSGNPRLIVSFFGVRMDLAAMIFQFPAGVDLFMVLSGFCLFWPMCKSPDALDNWDWRSYTKRRIRRIVPPYYAAILYAILVPTFLVALFRLLDLEAKWQPFPSAWQFITHLLFIHTFFLETWNGITGAFWSLGLEAQFYLVFPLVVVGFRRFGVRFLWFMVGISVLYRVAASVLMGHADGTVQFLWSIFFLGRWMQFALGMAAAWIVAHHWREGRMRDGQWGTAALVGALFLYILAVSELPASLSVLPLRDLLLAAAFAGGIIALCTTRTPVRAVFENKAVTGLGFISYSVFLIHQPTAWYFSEFLRKKLLLSGTVHFALMCTLGLILVVGISYLFFLVCEKPFLGAPSRARKSPAAPALPGVTVPEQAAP